MILNKSNKKILVFLLVTLFLSSCRNIYHNDNLDTDKNESTTELIATENEIDVGAVDEDNEEDYVITTKEVILDLKAPYATFSVINDGKATLYKVGKKVNNYKGITIAVNAGHGTKGGSKVKTFSHPDYSPKAAGGSTAKGEIMSVAVSVGTTFLNGMTEADANLMVANLLTVKLLNEGYSVLMIRKDDNCRLDNIARTVIANQYADAHVSIHFDTTDYDKGIFYVTPIEDELYLNMEPLKSNKNNIIVFGRSIIKAFKTLDFKIWKGGGELAGDLTQLSFSTIPSVNIELGDRATVLTNEKFDLFAEGIKIGVENYFNNGK